MNKEQLSHSKLLFKPLLPERDIAILQFINDFGFCEMPQLDQRFGFKRTHNYWIMKRLIDDGFVSHHRVLHNQHGIYYLTTEGAAFTDLPPIHRIPFATYVHDLTVLDIHLALRQRYFEANWISERRLKHEKYQHGVGQKGHIADGFLLFPDNKQIAIEVELTFKNKERINKILKNYAMQPAIKEVWYFCPVHVANVLKPLAVKWPFIQIHLLHEIVHERKR